MVVSFPSNVCMSTYLYYHLCNVCWNKHKKEREIDIDIIISCKEPIYMWFQVLLFIVIVHVVSDCWFDRDTTSVQKYKEMACTTYDMNTNTGWIWYHTCTLIFFM